MFAAAPRRVAFQAQLIVQSKNDRMETCRGTVVVRRRNLARFSVRHPRFSLDHSSHQTPQTNVEGLITGRQSPSGIGVCLSLPVSQIVLFAVGEYHALSKRATEQNDAIHQVIWAGLRPKQGFVVRRVGSMVTTISVSLLTLAQMRGGGKQK